LRAEQEIVVSILSTYFKNACGGSTAYSPKVATALCS